MEVENLEENLDDENACRNGVGDLDEYEIDLSARGVAKALNQIKKVATTNRKKRIKALESVVEYMVRGFASAENEDESMQQIVENIDDFIRLIIGALELMLPLSEKFTKNKERVISVASDFNQALEMLVRNLKCWCDDDEVYRPEFFSLTSNLLSQLLNYIAENVESWFYNITIGSNITFIVWVWGNLPDRTKVYDWSKTAVATMYKLARGLIRNGDFSCKYLLMIVIQQWLVWIDDQTGLTFLNACFPKIDQSLRKSLQGNGPFDNDYNAREFLNTIHFSPRGSKIISSLSCFYFFAGDDEIKPPDHSQLADFWVDFSSESGRIHMFCSIGDNTWSDINIEAEIIDSVCVSWARKKDKTSFCETQNTDTQISRLTNLSHDSLYFLHIRLKDEFAPTTKDMVYFTTKAHQSLYFVFRDITKAEETISMMQFPMHTCGERSCSRPKNLENLLRENLSVNLTQFSSVTELCEGKSQPKIRDDVCNEIKYVAQQIPLLNSSPESTSNMKSPQTPHTPFPVSQRSTLENDSEEVDREGIENIQASETKHEVSTSALSAEIKSRMSRVVETPGGFNIFESDDEKNHNNSNNITQLSSVAELCEGSGHSRMKDDLCNEMKYVVQQIPSLNSSPESTLPNMKSPQTPHTPYPVSQSSTKENDFEQMHGESNENVEVSETIYEASTSGLTAELEPRISRVVETPGVFSIFESDDEENYNNSNNVSQLSSATGLCEGRGHPRMKDDLSSEIKCFAQKIPLMNSSPKSTFSSMKSPQTPYTPFSESRSSTKENDFEKVMPKTLYEALTSELSAETKPRMSRVVKTPRRSRICESDEENENYNNSNDNTQLSSVTKLCEERGQLIEMKYVAQKIPSLNSSPESTLPNIKSPQTPHTPYPVSQSSTKETDFEEVDKEGIEHIEVPETFYEASTSALSSEIKPRMSRVVKTPRRSNIFDSDDEENYNDKLNNLSLLSSVIECELCEGRSQPRMKDDICNELKYVTQQIPSLNSSPESTLSNMKSPQTPHTPYPVSQSSTKENDFEEVDKEGIEYIQASETKHEVSTSAFSAEIEPRLSLVVETPGGFNIFESDDEENYNNSRLDNNNSCEDRCARNILNMSTATVESIMEDPMPRSLRQNKKIRRSTPEPDINTSLDLFEDECEWDEESSRLQQENLRRKIKTPKVLENSFQNKLPVKVIRTDRKLVRKARTPKILKNSLQNILSVKVLNPCPKVPGRTPCYLKDVQKAEQYPTNGARVVSSEATSAEFVDPYDFDRSYGIISGRNLKKKKTYKRKKNQSKAVKRTVLKTHVVATRQWKAFTQRKMS